MRKTLLASAAALGVALAWPALAQDTTPAPAAATDMRGTIAPALPAPAVGPGATPEQFLQAAQQDVQHHRGPAAQEALERAETRLLDRSTVASRANEPDSTPAVQEISQALDSVGKHDWQTAGQHIDAALRQAQMAQSDTGGVMTHQGMSSAPPIAAPAASGTVATPAAMGAMPGKADMTTGTTSVPMGGVEPPNGGDMAPNGGVMKPNVP